MARAAALPERPSPSQLTGMTGMRGNPFSERLRRASRLLRDRLNYMEAPPGPLPPQRKRLLSHQTSRLSRIVERLLIASKRYDEEHREFPYSHPRSVA